MRVETIEELDEIAKGFILGTLNPLSVHSLNMFDSCLVLNLAAAYSCVKIGTLSPMDCAKIKLKLFNEYQYYRRRIIDLEESQKTWIENTRELDVELTELTKLIGDENADPGAITRLALEIIDRMTGEFVLLKLFRRVQSDEAFKEEAINTVIKYGDYYIEKFGDNVPYIPLLEAFYAGACKDGTAEMFRQLDADNIRAAARKNIPIRKDVVECKVVAQSIREMFLLTKRKGKEAAK